MFRDRRSFRGIGFRVPQIGNLHELVKLLPDGSTEVADQFLPQDGKHFQTLHCFYFSRKAFFTSRSNMDQYPRKKIRGIEHFRYNLYFISITIKQARTYFIAVPFLPMALEIYPWIRENLRGKNPQYKSFRLPELIAALQANENMAGALKITRIKHKVDGDDLIDSLVFRGKNLPHSPTYKSALAAIPDDGPKLGPEQVRLAYSTKGQHFTMEVDKNGHCKFWLSSKAMNLHVLYDIVTHLYQHNLLKESASFPYMKSIQDEDEEDRE